MPQYTLLSTWHEAYRHIAVMLHETYKASTTNPAQHLYYKLIGTKFAELNKGRLFRDRLSRISEWGLDPIQVFASFNYPRIGEKRVDFINALLEVLNSDKRVDRYTSFEGCPSPIITQIIQYRGWKVQNQVWEMFDAIMRQSTRGLQNKHFIALKEWSGLDIASFTMFLFWIDSAAFIPLDRNTVDFLRTLDIITKRPRTYKAYIDLHTSKLHLWEAIDLAENTIRNLVRDAYHDSDNLTIDDTLSDSTVALISRAREDSQSRADLEQKIKQAKKERVNGFQVIALRPGTAAGKEGGEQPHLKNLQQGRLYQFYQAYRFDAQSDDTIVYNAGDEPDLYSKGNLNISISAIVGKNGSGKSTLVELLYLIINKIAVAQKINASEKLVDETVYADLFIKLDKLLKITVGTSVAIFEYNLDSDNNTYTISKEKIEAASFDLERFCYTIAINYSLYTLNTNITGNWIYPLFHKNDSYQTPIVLNPLRTEGNIDVNNEEGLAKSRMLSNILEPEFIDFETNIIPELIPHSKPVTLILEFDKAKTKRKKADFRLHYDKIYQGQINRVIEVLGITNIPRLKYAKEAKEYIYFKIVTIADRYTNFKNFEYLPVWIFSHPEKLQKYMARLLEDTSHITFKLRQAINYLQHGIYQEGDNNILEIAGQLRDIKETSVARIIELVPPAFFKINLKFDHGGTFNQLSSGEKQQVFSINTIAYHIYNVASVNNEEKTYKYRHINIIFDEVELYFHPEMQRTYISHLLHRIKHLPLEDNIHNINILFITHSPFILSDIPSANILRLSFDPATKKSVPAANPEQTFGANIHDALANDFFLENGFMGEFARKKINKIIRYLTIHSIAKRLAALNQKEEDNNTKVQKTALLSELALWKAAAEKETLTEEEPINITAQLPDESLFTKEINSLIKQQNFMDLETCRKIIEITGEPILRHKLMDMYRDIFGAEEEKNKKLEDLRRLADELNYNLLKK